MRFLRSFARVVDAISETTGVILSWAALLMVLVQFVVVVMRYVFGVGSIFAQESIVYMHGTMFMVAVGYTLLHDGHVRVDIFYSDANQRQRALVNFCGVFVFLLPVCILTWWVSWPFVTAAWAVYEGSQEGSGIQAVFLLKTVILVFAAALSVQGLSMAARSLFMLMGVSDEAAGPADDEAPTR